MDTQNILEQAIKKAGGPAVVAKACGLLSYQAVKKWERAGNLPRTEWTGETNYAEILETLTDGAFTKDQLLSVKPEPKQQKKRQAAA